MTTIRTGKTWEDALVQADMCLDNGDAAAADRWRLIGHVQDRLERLWTEGKTLWTVTQLRTLLQHRRILRVRFKVGERFLSLSARFIRQSVEYRLFEVTKESWDYQCVGQTFVRRERLASNSDVVSREVAERLVK